MNDRLLGVVCLALAAFLIWRATLVELSFIVDPLGPKAFPIIIGGVLGLAGLYPLLKPDPQLAWPGAGGFIEIAIAVIVLIAYALLLPEVGFVVTTAVAASILGWRLGSRPLMAAIAGTSISLGIYVIFHLILGLSLARGPWGF
ncbi:MAG TPA: tripartite tricarboxylate transporter TctB family protein [Hyphomicrobiales bacterium]|nr:tripartite tricarboxylate transporter TctB family protein [Hyphomicrobiales bacterium]